MRERKREKDRMMQPIKINEPFKLFENSIMTLPFDLRRSLRRGRWCSDHATGVPDYPYALNMSSVSVMDYTISSINFTASVKNHIGRQSETLNDIVLSALE